MTVATGEGQIVPVDEARRLTERIRLTALTVREGIEKLQTLVERAKAGHVHEALGYPSWTAYLADTLGDQPLRLPRDQRQELVGYLAGEGMSTRAIGAVVGADHVTVARDLSAGVANETPAPVTGLDGKTYTRPEPVVDVITGEIDPEPVPQAAPQSRRLPLPEAFFRATYDLTKLAQRIENLTRDDRFARNADQVAAYYRSDLIRARDLLTQVIDVMPINQSGE